MGSGVKSKSVTKSICLLALVIIMAIIAVTGENNQSSSGGSGSQIVEVALAEVGTVGGAKYRQWYIGYADGQPWCASFVSWCAEQVGLIDAGIIPKFQSCTAGVNIFKNMGIFVYSSQYGGESYTPKAGDIIFYTGNFVRYQSTHVGIVQYTENGQVFAIEGNASDAVRVCSYRLTDQFILGYALPNYPVSEGVIQGSTNAEIAWNYFKSLGFNDYATAGILGNLEQESGIDPLKYQSNGPGRGICQWEVGGRFELLCAFANSKGTDWTDMKTQLDFLWYELNGGDATTKSILDRNYGGINGLKNASSIEWAVEAFEKSFERAGTPRMSTRISYAYSYYNTYSKGKSS